MPKYRVSVYVRGVTAMAPLVVEADDALHAASKIGLGMIRDIGGGRYADSLGRELRVELIADGRDEPLPRNGKDEG